MTMPTTSYPWTHQFDLGMPPSPGSAEFDPVSATLHLHSADAAEAGRDAGHGVWHRLHGDASVSAHIPALALSQGSGNWAGLMARTHDGADAPCLSVARHGESQVVIRRRHQTGEAATEEIIQFPELDWLELARTNGRWRLSMATRGGLPVDMDLGDCTLGEQVFIGPWVAATAAGQTASARFTNVRWARALSRSHSLYEQTDISSRLEVLELATGVRRVIHESPTLFEAPNWSRDGQFLVFNEAGRLRRLDLADGQIRTLDTGHATRNNNDHVLSFDGQSIALSHQSPPDGHSRIYTVPICGGEPRLITPQGPSYLHGWSPDGAHLVFTGRRPGHEAFNLYRVRVTDSHEERLTDCPRLDDGPEYTPDGRHIVFNSARSGPMRLWRMPSDGGPAEALTDPEGADGLNDWFPHVSPDGQKIAFLSYLPGEVEPQDHPGGRRVVLRLMERDGGDARVIAYLHGGQGTMNVHSWSPDGRFLAFVSYSRPLSD